MKLRVLNPQARCEVPQEEVASRLADLNGKRIGLVQIYPRHEPAIRKTMDVLNTRFKGLEFISLPKGYPTDHMEALLGAAKEGKVDAVIGAIGA